MAALAGEAMEGRVAGVRDDRRETPPCAMPRRLGHHEQPRSHRTVREGVAHQIQTAPAHRVACERSRWRCVPCCAAVSDSDGDLGSRCRSRVTVVGLVGVRPTVVNDRGRRQVEAEQGRRRREWALPIALTARECPCCTGSRMNHGATPTRHSPSEWYRWPVELLRILPLNDVICDPIVTRPSGILEQHAGGNVACVRAAHHHHDVLVAVAIEVGECGAVPLLKMAETPVERDCLSARVQVTIFFFGQAPVTEITPSPTHPAHPAPCARARRA